MLPLSCVREEMLRPQDYCEEGLATRISLKVGVPEMSVATRADMPDGMDSRVNSLWIGIFSASSHKCTYAKLYTSNLPSQLQSNHGDFAKFEINAVSGPSYIVAVANPVNNYGYQYVGSEGPVSRQALNELLPAATDPSFTWEDYQNIAIRQLTLGDVNTPIGNLVMSGIYFPNTADPSAKSWEDANYTSVNIPALASDGKTITLNGAVHLRRLISQVKFKIQAVDYNGSNEHKREPVVDGETNETISSTRRILQVIPQSFQVKNVPYTSWLHERKAASSPDGIKDGLNEETNSGDVIRLNSTSITYNDATLPLKANYRRSAWFNGSQYLVPHYETDENGMLNPDPSYYTFDFWMLENKRWASYDLYKDLGEDEDAYDRREKEIKVRTSETIRDDDGSEQTVLLDKNQGIYTALCSPNVLSYDDSGNLLTEDQVPETMNNCASFVEIRCRIIYTDDGLDAIKKEEDYKDVEYRSAEAIYTIHLGGIKDGEGKPWNDFTHRRNHIYSYNVTVMDIDRIIVEARTDAEPRPGIEGVVTDVVNPPYEVDAHYAVFNIQLCNLERTGGGIVQKDGDDPNTGFGKDDEHLVNGGKYERGVFPFRIRYYDKDNFAVYIDQSNIDEFQGDDELYWTWVEFRPTEGPDVIADYRPYWDRNKGEKPKYADGKTFRLNEVADIKTYPHPHDEDVNNPDPDDKTLRWYTVFINEYVYESDLDEGDNNFVNYVNKSPRMCWINTLFRSSIDDESNYIRSKYVVRQQSIQTFYDNIPYSPGDKSNAFNAIGMEHINETFGYNLRWDDVTTKYSDEGVYESDEVSGRSHDIKNNNGRHNTLLYIGGTPIEDNNRFTKGGKTDRYKRFEDDPATGEDANKPSWRNYVDPNRLLYVKGFNDQANQNYKEDIPNPNVPFYMISAKPYENPDNNHGNTANMGSSNINTTYYLRILDACMNRNRDNNGNGVIDLEEVRWYVPASSEIVDFVLGRNSLETPLLDYNKNFNLDNPTKDVKTELAHQSNTRFHFATSNQRVLWAEEGASLNPEVDLASRNKADGSKWDWNLPPQQVRCVRALGTDLETDNNADLTPAFTTNAQYEIVNGLREYSRYPTEIYPEYYHVNNQRQSSSNDIRPHQETTPLNRLSYYGFEFSPELYEFEEIEFTDLVFLKGVEHPGHYEHEAGWYTGDGKTYLGPDEYYDINWEAKHPEWRNGKLFHKNDGYYKAIPGTDNNIDWGQFVVQMDREQTEIVRKEGWYNLSDYSSTEKAGYEYFNGEWYGGTNHPAGWFAPDLSTYQKGDKNTSPGEGYLWWDETPIYQFPSGYYFPDPNSGPKTEAEIAGHENEYVKMEGIFGTQWSGGKNHYLFPDTQTQEYVWGYAWFNGEWSAGLPGTGYYEVDFNFNGNRGAKEAWIRGFWYGTQLQPGYYARGELITYGDLPEPGNLYPDNLPRYKDAGNVVSTIREGWYKAKESDKGVADQSGYKQYPEWYEGGTYIEAGWYRYSSSSIAGYTYFDEITQYYPNGRQYMGNSMDYSPEWKPGYGIYIRDADDYFPTVDCPAGWYSYDGIYLGEKEHYLNSDEDKKKYWDDLNPKFEDEEWGDWIEGWTEPDEWIEVPAEISGKWNDPHGNTVNLFVYNAGNFVRDHGTTLGAANAICAKKKNGSEWRLPTMKEAALIKIALENAGMYKPKDFVRDGPRWTKYRYNKNGINYDIGNFLTCTYREFGVVDENRSDNTGYYTGVYYPEIEAEASPGDYYGDNNEYLIGRLACITTNYNRHFYIRCVRDLQTSND